ncbi:methyltransferase domain-containing protein [Roseibacillus persicicus]|uniref:class I SAM-dependent methyltransferase n=1 Tax=Roseibacillus persicicus TaxID=454148 RepID=UPI00398B9816
MKREVVPEILDELDGSDPRALRSRRDLRLINALMGNERWIVRELARRASAGAIAELGAGHGELLQALAEKGWDCGGYDLQPKPAKLNSGISWAQGDFFETLGDDRAPIVVGSLILHHFEDGQLQRLGELLASRQCLVFAEPLRSSLALAEGYTLFPFVNEVTRHDMIVSIRAGFEKGELPRKLGLIDGWRWMERVTLRGGLRSFAVREGVFN